jgi:hypothetical protein
MGMRAWLRRSARAPSAVARTAIAASIVASVSPAATAWAEGCSNESLREREAYATLLPDCRAYEQVSPVAKNLTDAVGGTGIVQAAPSGGAVTFFSVASFRETAGFAKQLPTYLGTRSSGDEWVTDGVVPPAFAGSDGQVIGLSEDLARTILLAEESSGGRNAYIVDDATGSYRLLAGGLPLGASLSFADATPGGSRVLFETKAQLTENAVPNAYNLYEWSEATGEVSLAGVLAGGEAPAGGSVAGPGGPAVAPKAPGGSTMEFYTQHTISEDGSRIFFTASGSGVIYMREPEAGRTVQVSAGSEPAQWRAATPTGSYVLYTEGEDLYRFDVEAEAREALTEGAAGVQGTLGMSEDGSYVYFVATDAKLAKNENGNKESAEAGADNLYEWHENHATEIVFIAKLLGKIGAYHRDEPDWREYHEKSEGSGPAGGEKSSRVTSGGTAVLFSSVAQLTSYENNEHIELYLYDTGEPLSAANPACVSCNPNEAPAGADAHLSLANETLAVAPTRRNAFLTRNLSENGRRVFFQTEEALLTGASNEQVNVYEWERAGEGTCERSGAAFVAGDAGCLYLISTGQSEGPSYFGDAGAEGGEVFFFTRQPLVGQDRDFNVDVYDARVDGGIAAQNPQPSPSPCNGEACREETQSPPVFGPLASMAITGAGNVLSAQPSAAAKPKARARARRLAGALKACRKKPANKRHACRRRARRRYGKKKHARGGHKQARASRKAIATGAVRRRRP